MNAVAIVNKMLENDSFSQWLGVELLEIKPGYCRLSMEVREEMLNGFKLAHGGISYSLADSALAFASNSNGKHALSIETSISHVAAVKEGDVLIAVAEEKKLGKTTGLYYISLKNSTGKEVAFFKGTVFLTDKNWE